MPAGAEDWQGALNAALGDGEPARRAIKDWIAALDIEAMQGDAFVLAPLIVANKTRLGIASSVPRLRGLYRSHSSAQQTLRRAAAQLAEDLHGQEIPIMVDGGFALACIAYASTTLRPEAEVRFRVHTADLSRARALLDARRNQGPAVARAVFRNIQITDRPHPSQDDGAGEALWSNPITVMVDGTEVLAPNATNLLLELLWSLRGARDEMPLRWRIDLVSLLRAGQPIDWNEVTARIRQWGASDAVWSALNGLEALFKGLIPAPVLASLGQRRTLSGRFGLHGGWRWFANQLRHGPAWLAPLLVLQAVLQLADVPVLLLLHEILTRAVPAQDLGAILRLGLWMLGIRMAAAGASLTVSAWTHRAMRGLGARMRQDVMARILAMDWAAMTGLAHGAAQNRVVNEVERTELTATAVFQTTLPSLLPLAAYVAFLAYLSWPVALVVAALGVVRLAGARVPSGKLGRAIAAYHAAFEGMVSETRRQLAMLRLTRLMVKAPAELERYEGQVTGLARSGVAMAMAGAESAVFGSFISGLALVLIPVTAALLVAEGRLALGSVVIIWIIASQLNGIGARLSEAPRQFQTLDASLRSLGDLLAACPAGPAFGRHAADFQGALTLTGASYGHGVDGLLFDNVDLVLKPGSITVLTGPNGSGKSTLVEILLGLRPPASGLLRLGESPVSELDPLSYRGSLGYVPQHPLIFKGSLRENIVFGVQGEVDGEALSRAIGLARLDGLIAQLPLGLDSDIADIGESASGGERQRIALARAIVSRPDILILDEPTNHLDTDAIRQLILDIRARALAPTLLMITHDPRLIRLADQHFHLEGGQLERRPIAKGAAR